MSLLCSRWIWLTCHVHRSAFPIACCVLLCRCASPLLTIAAALGHGRPMWVNPPPDKRGEAAAARQALAPQVHGCEAWITNAAFETLQKETNQCTSRLLSAACSCIIAYSPVRGTSTRLCISQLAVFSRNMCCSATLHWLTSLLPRAALCAPLPTPLPRRPTASAATTWQWWRHTTAGWRHALQGAGALAGTLHGSTLCLNRWGPQCLDVDQFLVGRS